MIKLISLILIYYLVLELFLSCLINYLSLKKSWIVLNKDEYPNFNKNITKIFFKKTFDKYLGWNWKPNTSYQEKIFSKINKIYFGSFGERKDVKLKKK